MDISYCGVITFVHSKDYLPMKIKACARVAVTILVRKNKSLINRSRNAKGEKDKF